MTRAHVDLVIVPCGRRKLWDKQAMHGPALAAEAYTSPLFALNRKYAEQTGDRWLVLSAKYGLIAPDFSVTGPYNVSFKRKQPEPIGVAALRRQAGELGLKQGATVIALGGIEYRQAVSAAFEGLPVVIKFPFSGLTIGYLMRAMKAAVRAGP